MAITRSITSKESLRFLKNCFEGYDHLGINLANHKKTRGVEDTYQVTVDKLSDAILEKMISEDLVKDVYYCPLTAPPGQGYGITLRYRMFIVYEKVSLKRKRQ